MIKEFIAQKLFGISFLGRNAGVEGWSSTRQWLLNALPNAPTTRPVTLDDAYERSNPIAVAISCIADDSATLPWDLYPPGPGEKAIIGHPLTEVMKNANEYLPGDQLFVGSYISKLLFGEFIWYYPDLVLPKQGRSPELFNLERQGQIDLLDPRRVKAKIVRGEVKWFLCFSGQDDIPLDSKKLTISKRFNPYNQLRGLSALTAVLVEASGDIAAAEFNRSFFGDRNGTPSGLLKPGEKSLDVKPEQREDYLKQWNAKHGGGRRSVGLLPPGWDWVDLGVTQKDMDFRSLREYSREQILAMLGVPPFVAGVLDKANYANAREQKELYWQGTIFRFLHAIKNDLNYSFLPNMGLRGYELHPRWEVVKALLEDLNKTAETAKRFWEMGIPLDQINTRLDLGFDMTKISHAKTSYVPVSMVPADLYDEQLEANIEAAEASAEAANDPPAPTPAEASSSKPKPAKSALLLHGPAGSEARRILAWKLLTQQTAVNEFKYNRVLRRHLHEIGQEIRANLEGIRGMMLRRAVKQRGEDSHPLFDQEQAKAALLAATLAIYRSTFGSGFESVIAELGLSVGFDKNSPALLVLSGLANARVGQITETVARQVAEALKEGIDNGDDVPALIERAQHVIKNALSRSAGAARGEVGWAFTAARYDAMVANGVREHMWLSARDAKVRDTHAPGAGVDGEIQPLGVAFSNGLRFPLDELGEADEVCGCRCVAVPVMRKRKELSA